MPLCAMPVQGQEQSPLCSLIRMPEQWRLAQILVSGLDWGQSCGVLYLRRGGHVIRLLGTGVHVAASLLPPESGIWSEQWL